MTARKRKPLDTMISARFTPDQARTLRRAADREGLTYSEFVRRAALVAARPPDESRGLAEAGISVSPVGGPWQVQWSAGYGGSGVGRGD